MRTTTPLHAALIAAGLLAISAVQAQMPAADYKAAKDRISETYKTDKKACDQLSANAKDVCTEEAKGKEKIAKAELEYQHTGKADDLRKVTLAKAEAAYEVAKEKCDDLAGNDKDVCKKEAKAAEVKAKADVKVSKVDANARQDAAQDKRDADYKVALAKCDAMAGEAKVACVNSAKAQFGKS
ncbi:hypothetical protein [Aquabacterium sp.]|uniref:hypothetical protein n=1 Tax=Aquabacterium sp. TaxID=1872578 RepID=UPI002C8EA7C1|nr:hypothetical protein [Aquabacterium sp.]HSW04615.1 hypothetical protein [Aquabacterium sp.]